MKRSWTRPGLFGILFLVHWDVSAAASSPVVVELFESQGCSSCPPAERVMEKLRETFGVNVILLTFHVDYWDYLGWKDTFSDPLYTERQKDYGRAFQQDSIYTPEMVVQGQTGFTGSDRGQALSEVQARQAETRPALPVKIFSRSPDRAQVSMELPPNLVGQVREAVAVIYENAAPVRVLRGENRGETMSGDFAVRTILKLPVSSKEHVSFDLPINPAWNRGALGVAVLVRGDSSKILAAAQTSF